MNDLQLQKKVTYEASSGVVELSPVAIRHYLVSGGGAVTDQEVLMFLKLCQGQRLDPFMKEAYLIKYSENSPAAMVTSKDVFNKRAEAQADYDGIESGLIVADAEGNIINKNGAFYRKERETILGAWAKVHRKSRAIPMYVEVNYDEYEGKKKVTDANGKWVKGQNGEWLEEPNSMWKSKPATMIIKVARVQALRETFPTAMAGMYTEDEMGVEVERPAIIDAQPESTPQVLVSHKTLEERHAEEDAILQAELGRQNLINSEDDQQGF